MRFELLILVSSLTACGLEPEPTRVSNQPVASPTCTGGDVIFQIDHMDVRRGRIGNPTASLIVRSSGEWTYDVRNDGNVLARTRQGCLAPSLVTTLANHVDGAPWIASPPRMMCEIGIMTFTQYSVRGRKVWASMACASDVLDDNSKLALDAARAIVRPLAPLN
jgi:hypothetical protein